MSHEQAMNAPIRCRGAGCQQGRCQSPMKCTGMTPEADAAIARIKSSLPKFPLPIHFAEPEPEEGGWWVSYMVVLAILFVVSFTVGYWAGR